jgi:hypothetical protein
VIFIQVDITLSSFKYNDDNKNNIMIMTRIFFLVTLVVNLASFEKEPPVSYGFDSTIKKFSDGMLIADIEGRYEKVYLHGIIMLSEGELLVNLLNAKRIVVYTKTLKVPVYFTICNTFFAESGIWKVSYKSNHRV